MSGQGRLLWRCRRGMAELDRMLTLYVDVAYQQADDAERQAFECLLDMPDADLWRCLTGLACPEDPALAALAAKLRILATGAYAAC
ncbi:MULTISPECIES: succinate dehydrogenase assembly factor 2 [Methylococcus]|uniref:FAD assembly factor SdhE n=1 Tax=Methylococcus capsulatus TaxID=414 RepID=A0ABZ2F4P1_METCP|nr:MULTISPECIES: succinate dehydrogenase assembly factor 2 [Methylococcus]MDF9391855.1 succinate dehydrogenase assembly factor 2 [Methylococcus capsulatus]